MQVTEEQKKILEDMNIVPGEDVEEAQVIPDGPRRYIADPGYTLVGVQKFPFETEDPELINTIEKSRGFRQGKIWIEMRSKEDREVTESALAELNVGKLRKMVGMLGYKNINKYRKYELLDILMKKGF